MTLAERKRISKELSNMNFDLNLEAWLSEHPEIGVQSDDAGNISIEFPPCTYSSEVFIVDGVIRLLRYQPSEDSNIEVFNPSNPLYLTLDRTLKELGM